MNAHYYNVLAEELGSDAIDEIMNMGEGGGMAAYGRWCVLRNSLAMKDGRIDLADERQHQRIGRRLQLKAEALDRFLDELAGSGLIDGALWDSLRVVVSPDIVSQLDYRSKQASAGKAKSKAKKNDGDDGAQPGPERKRG